MRIRTHGDWRSAALLLAGMLAGCAIPSPPLPFQQRASELMAYGYSDTKVDDLHYSLDYSDKAPDRAAGFLQLRAAQIAQGAGYAWFAFDARGDNVLTKTDYSLQREPIQHGIGRNGLPLQTADFIPTQIPHKVTVYYYSWGRITLLTPAQAGANPQALQVAQVLAQTANP